MEIALDDVVFDEALRQVTGSMGAGVICNENGPVEIEDGEREFADFNPDCRSNRYIRSPADEKKVGTSTGHPIFFSWGGDRTTRVFQFHVRLVSRLRLTRHAHEGAICMLLEQLRNIE